MKYDIHICSCGRIHFTRMRDVTRALTANKELAVICGGCGKVRITGANKGYEEHFEKDFFEMYRYDLQDKTEITRTQFKAGPKGKMLYKILYSEGIRVPMETGYFATKYSFKRFTDMQYPDFLTESMQRMGVFDFAEFQKKYEKWHNDMSSVNMYRLVYNSGMSEEQLEQLSCLYMPETFDWTDYPFGIDSRSAKVKKNRICMKRDFYIGEKYIFKIVNDSVKVFYKTSNKKYDYMLFDKEEFLEYFDYNLKGVNV